MTITVARLNPSQAPAVVACFQRVYGTSYANKLFYDAQALADAMENQRLQCVGAVTPDGRVVGHMAMSLYPGSLSVELGNTVVDVEARGGGLAWRIGDELTAWCVKLGFEGYLHYPTTDHHIMQRQSVKNGFETGLMLGYIPADTHGQVAEEKKALRSAVTIVYEPLQSAPGVATPAYLPNAYHDLVLELAQTSGVKRGWQSSGDVPLTTPSVATSNEMTARDLGRLSIARVGEDVQILIERHKSRAHSCLQIDFQSSDAAVDVGVEAARRAGFVFCGWLPGYRESDVLRLQWFDEAQTDLQPRLVNPVAERLLQLIDDELGG